MNLPRTLTLGAVISLSAACGTSPSDEDVDGDVASEALVANAAVSLKYEGTCEFLRSCSRYSRGLPEGSVLWGCSAENTAGNSGSCEDDELWVAGPTRAHCGLTATICRGEVCVDARVKDVSVSRSWEASNGVMSALGLSYGLTSKCSGFGGGSVRVTTSR